MSGLASDLVSSDLIWEITRGQNAYLVKQRTGGGSQLSRDPLNVINKHSRKYDGYVNDKAVGIQPGKNGGVELTTTKRKHPSRPAANKNQVSWGSNKSSRNVYKGIVNHTAKNGYRPDIRAESVARASAIIQSQRPKKETPEKKPRGAKARKLAESKST
ncbi:MAG: hypothetical protein M4579_003280 [Chaenotheca gracillima]|nr:MAG: hypothetical protein M4579_003280 [Chaenotheca gracillima]